MFFQIENKMTSMLVRQLCSGFLRPTIQFQPSIRTKMARRINRHRVPTHAKPSDTWIQKKNVYDMEIRAD